MAIINKPDIKHLKRYMPNNLKLILLLAFGLGIWLRSCWVNYQKDNILFENVYVENATNMSADVYFTLNNPTYKSGKNRIFIQLLTSYNDVVATKLTYIQIDAKSKTKYVKVIDKFKRPLVSDEKIIKATVEFY